MEKLATQKFIRRPFEVEGVQVTPENLELVAAWCNGDVREETPKTGGSPKKYVKVRVLRPLNERQTMAFPGDFVLYAGTGYKVYTFKSFLKVFQHAGTVSDNAHTCANPECGLVHST